MWLFGKRLNIRKAAKEEGEEEGRLEELPVFAPEIETGIEEYTEPVTEAEAILPAFDENEERPFTMPVPEGEEQEDGLPLREEASELLPSVESFEQEEQSEEQPEEEPEEQPEDVEEEEAEDSPSEP